jgi:hypothetical protein
MSARPDSSSGIESVDWPGVRMESGVDGVRGEVEQQRRLAAGTVLPGRRSAARQGQGEQEEGRDAHGEAG